MCSLSRRRSRMGRAPPLFFGTRKYGNRALCARPRHSLRPQRPGEATEIPPHAVPGLSWVAHCVIKYPEKAEASAQTEVRSLYEASFPATARIAAPALSKRGRNPSADALVVLWGQRVRHGHQTRSRHRLGARSKGRKSLTRSQHRGTQAFQASDPCPERTDGSAAGPDGGPGLTGRLVSKSQSGAFSPPWGEKRTLGIERPQRNGANPGRRSSADGRLQKKRSRTVASRRAGRQEILGGDVQRR
ncbi:hypothetical protein WMY93_005463 [Mugilogobius chulae]|uniref:Uncharacterized protein n=1 Tax=Mugilogobius chulae TaxID=88201 RepID=A0AAW0PNB3_9GOBI